MAPGLRTTLPTTLTPTLTVGARIGLLVGPPKTAATGAIITPDANGTRRLEGSPRASGQPLRLAHRGQTPG
eukprot:6411823-Lingulodinium_polyedra.AAC.1